jgi:hypothetical protein
MLKRWKLQCEAKLFATVALLRGPEASASKSGAGRLSCGTNINPLDDKDALAAFS